MRKLGRGVLWSGWAMVAACGVGSVEWCAPAGRADPPRSLVADASPWSSPEGCEVALRTRRTRARRPGHAAIATWNVRWFPDGVPFGSRERARPTNVDWLACAIAWLSVDVVALQEIQAHPAAVDAMARLVGGLDARTRGRWRVGLDECSGPSFQHVALLWNTSRVRAGELRTLGALNPRGSPCASALRPGFGGRMRFAGGLDLHVVSVHLKSGDQPSARALRRRSQEALPIAFAALQAIEREQDMVIAGDFNTHGCGACTPAETPEQEIATIDAADASFSPGLRRVPVEPGCSYYARGRAYALDHFVTTRAMRELPAGARATAEGVCAEASCATIPRRDPARALRELSDHCPVVLEIPDRDRD
ncbi:MAG: endonuclease/exonuclease/phosphatase family protein [Deltaproteobacteria bacterium]|nr:endonuclease/exonuclease/phosphatase family protein [Deltaproteobacteria bacterium]